MVDGKIEGVENNDSLYSYFIGCAFPSIQTALAALAEETTYKNKNRNRGPTPSRFSQWMLNT